MFILRFAAWMFPVVLALLGTSGISGQDYPNKPVRIVTSGLGGGSDFTARLIAQAISGPLGQSVIVDNRGGNLPAEIVSGAPPDGYTLLADGSSFWTGPLLQKMAYDPVRNFSAVTMTSREVSVLVVQPSVPVKSVRELIDLARAKPGQLNYSSSGVGGGSHLAGELFKSMAGINIVRVPYKNAGSALVGLIGGETQLMFPSAAAAAQHLKSGKLRALAVTSAEPSVLAPGLPVVAATLPGFESAAISGIFAPAKTPEAIINRLNLEMVRFLKTADAREKLFNSGTEAVGSSPAEFAAAVKSDIAKWGKLIKDAGIKVE